MNSPIEKKWDAIYRARSDVEVLPAPVLSDHAFLLPEQGVALDLACGLGGNAMFLAEHGLEVHAFDISSLALNKLQQLAKSKDLQIKTRQVNIQPEMLTENSFDVIVIARFLDRTLSSAIMAALKPRGLLFYQTYTMQKITTSPPNRLEFLLTENELLKLFAPLRVVFYREYGRIGNLNYGERNEALFIGQKT